MEIDFEKRPFKIAGYAGLLVFGVAFVISILNSFLSNFIPASVFISLINPIEAVVISVLAAVFFYGYVVLGRKLGNNLLRNMALISIVLIFASIVIIYALLISNDLINLASSESVSISDFFEELSASVNSSDYFTGFLETLLFIHFFIVIFWGLQGILFGIALKRMGDHIPDARTAGILNIVAGATYVIFIGYFIAAIAYIYNVIIMIEVSKIAAKSRSHDRGSSKTKKKRR